LQGNPVTHVMLKSIAATIAFLFIYFVNRAQSSTGASTCTTITCNSQATHIAAIIKDTIVLAKSSTYLFSVDTPEDGGLVSTECTVAGLPHELQAKDTSAQQYAITDKNGTRKDSGIISNGDRLLVTAADGKASKTYYILVQPMALSGVLVLQQPAITVSTTRSITLSYTAGQRSPDMTVKVYIPAGIDITMKNTTVNVIGRGTVPLGQLAIQSVGRVGSRYPYKKVGEVAIQKRAGGSVIVFSHLDLRPANGADLVITINGVSYNKEGQHIFKATYTTAKPEVLTSPGIGNEMATLTVTPTVADFERIPEKLFQYKETPTLYTSTRFTWSALPGEPAVQVLYTLNDGRSWLPCSAVVDSKRATATVTGLLPGKLYLFKLVVQQGKYKGFSNTVQFLTGKLDIKSLGVSGNDNEDNTDKINKAISFLHETGGGTLLFSKGVYNVRTIHLQSNVYLYIEKGATIQALKGTDAPECTWFCDKKYRSGLSPTDAGPYADPENYMTKQDVGHHYFRNSMFFGERLDNVKIIGNGYITGNGNLVTGDRVMNNAPDNRGDKLFTFKLCTNIEIGGLYREQDLWYDEQKDEPYYIAKNDSTNTDTDNMLHIDRSGHFALLATGTDTINVHDTYFGQQYTSNVRDIYDFMACNNVRAVNIYSKVSSDDIIKPGSDCSLGFTRPARHYMIRNIIGDTNCNLFQVGSETADDIMDVHVDNIYVLGANKAGFSISTNDGAHIKDIHLNCGHTGPLHSRSKMMRTFAPFFISISNRGRIIGAEVGEYTFRENGEQHRELLVKNINIGQVENIILNDIDVTEVYAGSSFNGKRWKAYDGTQRRATPIIAGYSLPNETAVTGGLNFRLPNGLHTGYIKNIAFSNVNILVKGGNPVSDTARIPPELGVGQYNAANLGTEPSFGVWARHVKGLTLHNCNFNYEQPDGRHALLFDDVTGATVTNVQTSP